MNWILANKSLPEKQAFARLGGKRGILNVHDDCVTFRGPTPQSHNGTVYEFNAPELANIEWLDEGSETDQDMLWKELDQIVFNASGGNRIIPDYVIDLFKEKYILIRK